MTANPDHVDNRALETAQSIDPITALVDWQLTESPAAQREQRRIQAAVNWPGRNT